MEGIDNRRREELNREWVRSRRGVGVDFPPLLVREEVGVVVHFRVDGRPRQDRREVGVKEIHCIVHSPRKNLLADI